MKFWIILHLTIKLKYYKITKSKLYNRMLKHEESPGSIEQGAG